MLREMCRFLSKVFFLTTCCSLVFLFFTGKPIPAQDSDVSRLQSRISELEARVQELEGIVREYHEAKKAGDMEIFGWQNKKNWRRLSVGMQETQVKGLLGEPGKVIQGVKTLWYYPKTYGGYLTFDEKGRLLGWNEP